jgi:hypothetical protein
MKLLVTDRQQEAKINHCAHVLPHSRNFQGVNGALGSCALLEPELRTPKLAQLRLYDLGNT